MVEELHERMDDIHEVMGKLLRDTCLTVGTVFPMVGDTRNIHE